VQATIDFHAHLGKVIHGYPPLTIDLIRQMELPADAEEAAFAGNARRLLAKASQRT